MDDNISNTSAPAPTPDVAELNQRRNLIKSLYQEVLGREADINGLSYYTVHKEITEDQIRKQMTQSTDHRDVIIKAQRYPELEKKCIDLEDQIIRLQNANTEKDALIANLRAVTSSMQTAPKNPQTTSSYAYDMMQPVNYPQPNNNYYTQPQQQPNYSANPNNNAQKQKSKGCLGFIKNFLGI